MATSKKTDDYQSKFNQLRKILNETAGIIIDYGHGKIPSLITSVASEALATIQHGPATYNDISTGELIKYFTHAYKLNQLISKTKDIGLIHALGDLEYATALSVDLIEDTVSTDRLRYREHVREALIEKHIETEKVQERLDQLSNKVITFEKIFTESTLPVQTAKDQTLAEMERLLTDFRAAATKNGQELVVVEYRDGARIEKENSDKFRNYAGVLMLASTTILAYSMFSFHTGAYSTNGVLVSVIASLFLGIPAAYFARESTRHRQQQYLYQQYSFNLNALGPFLADFDKNRKDDLKTELAKKLFAMTSQSNTKGDTYPVNIQEILMLLLSKANTSPAAKKARKRALEE